MLVKHLLMARGVEAVFEPSLLLLAHTFRASGHQPTLLPKIIPFCLKALAAVALT